MEFPTKILAGIGILIIALAAGIYILTLQERQEPLLQKPSPQETIPQERILVQFLGKPVSLDKDKEEKATQMFFSMAQRSPDKYGLITLDDANDNVKQAMQQTAIGLANFSIIDLACESITDEAASCDKINDNYKKSRAGIPSHFELFPPSEYTCEAVRAEAKQSTLCTDTVSGHAAYLCAGAAKKDCKNAYKEMIQDYAYTEMALTTGESGFCQLVSEASIRSGCLAGDKDTVRNDLIKGLD